MSQLLDAKGVVIEYFETVPTTPGMGIIRLPRCGHCFDELHDYSFGRAYCIPAELIIHRQQKEYGRMTVEQHSRWSEAEMEEQQRREREAQ